MDADTDHGTVLPPGSVAVVWNATDGWHLLIPSNTPPDTPMADEVLALTGAFLRLSREPDFRNECSRFFMDVPRS